VYLNSVRNPHGILIRISQNFDKTKNIFLGEAIINLAISLLLVKRFGIAGVLAGTMASVFIRDFYVIRFVYNEVLNSNPWKVVYRIIVNAIPIGISMCSFSSGIFFNANSYIALFVFGVACFFFATVLVLICNLVFCYKGFSHLYSFVYGRFIKNILSKYVFPVIRRG